MSKKNHPLRYSIHSRLREFHLRRLMPSAGGRLLDVGCGLGYLLESLGGEYETVGLEYDIESLKNNKKRGLVNMVQGDASYIPFARESFDVVLCSELLEHLPDGKDTDVLEGINAVLKPGGLLLITVPSLEGLRAQSKWRNLGHDDKSGGEYHYRIGYSWDALRCLIGRFSGWRIESRRYSMCLFSELFMDLMKIVYFKKNRYKEQSDIMGVDDSFVYKMFRLLFPLMYCLFVLEDVLFTPFFKGHIIIVAVKKDI